MAGPIKRTTCYGRESFSKNAAYLDAFWTPCGIEILEDGHDVHCCQLGDICLDNNMCYANFPHYKDGLFRGQFALPNSVYYVGGCTDSTLSSINCSTHCTANYYTDAIYKNGQWQCCSTPSSGLSVDCKDPIGAKFDAPSPEELRTLIKLPEVNSADLEGLLSFYLPSSLANLRTESPSVFTKTMTNIFKVYESRENANSFTIVDTPTWAIALPSSGIAWFADGAPSGFFTESYFDGARAFLSAELESSSGGSTTTQTVLSGVSSGGSAGNHDGSNGGGDDNLGVKIGVPVAIIVLLIIAVVFGLLIWQRRRRGKSPSGEALATGHENNQYPAIPAPMMQADPYYNYNQHIAPAELYPRSPPPPAELSPSSPMQRAELLSSPPLQPVEISPTSPVQPAESHGSGPGSELQQTYQSRVRPLSPQELRPYEAPSPASPEATHPLYNSSGAPPTWPGRAQMSNG